MNDRQKAKQIYLDSNGSIALVDIAEQLGRPNGTIRGWKSRDQWDAALLEDVDATLQDECNVAKEKVGAETKHEDKAKVNIVKEVVSNSKLTDKQQMFCIYYLKYFNATKAYQKAYKSSYITANTNGPALLVKTGIKEEIERLKLERIQGIHLDSKDILQKYIDIAFSDITDYMKFGTEEVVQKDKNNKVKLDADTGKPLVNYYNYIYLENSNDIDGTILSEVSQGKDGIKVKLQDKMKALDWISRNYFNISEEYKQKHHLTEVKIEQEKLRVDKLKQELGNTDKEPIEIRLVTKDENNGS